MNDHEANRPAAEQNPAPHSRRAWRWLSVAAIASVVGVVTGIVWTMDSTSPDSTPPDSAAAGTQAGAAATLPAATAEAFEERPLPIGLERSISYERGEERAEFAHTHLFDALGTTDEAARRGERAGFAILRADAPEFASGHRTEWNSGLEAAVGDEVTYALSYWFPSDWDQYGETDTFSSRIIFQIHSGDNDAWSPLYGIRIVAMDGAPRVDFYRKDGRSGPDTVLWRRELVTEQWLDFVLHVRWEVEPVGMVRFYQNAELVYEADDVPTLPSPASPYAKWGIYGQPARILFDEVRIALGPPVWDEPPS